jgi:hypothetical protein
MDAIQELRKKVTAYYEEHSLEIVNKESLKKASIELQFEMLTSLNKDFAANSEHNLTLEERITQDATFAAMDLLGQDIIYDMLSHHKKSSKKSWIGRVCEAKQEKIKKMLRKSDLEKK